MKGLVIEIKNIGGKVLINGKSYIECSLIEKKFFDEFVKEIKNGSDYTH